MTVHTIDTGVDRPLEKALFNALINTIDEHAEGVTLIEILGTLDYVARELYQASLEEIE